VSTRTLQGRFLLSPRPDLNEIVIGILARAQRLSGAQLCAFVFLSTHYHLLVWVENALQLKKLMEYLNSNTAREVGRLVHWKEKFWSRRYQGILVSAEEEAQVGQLRYLLAHGVKEGLVELCGDWPGPHSVHALLTGATLKGFWFDRTREYAARLRGEDFGRLDYATPETLTLAPLPCWRHLTAEEHQARVAELVAAIDAEFAAAREQTGREPLGVEAIRRQDPHQEPNRVKKAPAPFCHAASRRVRRELYGAYRAFVVAFREGADKLKTVSPPVPFPAGSFPPAMPFVGG
jgi:REP element-mobilizing transposase RayT